MDPMLGEPITGAVIELVVMIALNFACVWAAWRLASDKGRSPKPWIWTAAVFGIVPLIVLILLPRRYPVAPGTRSTFTT